MKPEPIQPSPERAKQSLTDHVAAKGADIRDKYGPVIGWQQLQAILADRDCVRYPCELVFDADPLQAGEFAYALPKGDRPEDGYLLCVHPYYSLDPARVPFLALYHLVAVNYGAFASAEDAETFGAAVLGMSRDDYYAALCEMADEISTHPFTDAGAEASGCSCAGAAAESAPTTISSAAQLSKTCAEVANRCVDLIGAFDENPAQRNSPSLNLGTQPQPLSP